MPIEDVDFLKENCKKQQYNFLVNSADRDRIAYPTPSEYSISFTVPFYNVIGFEVIDGVIPRTMYNIDITNNLLYIFIYDSSFNLSTLSKDTFVAIEIEPGDYTIQTLIVAINSVLKMHVNDNSMNPLVTITIESITNPPETKNKVRFHCPYKFMIDMDASTISELLGFDLHANVSENSQPPGIQRYTKINYVETETITDSNTGTTNIVKKYENYRLFGSVDLPFNTIEEYFNEKNQAYPYISDVYNGPRGVIRKTGIKLPNAIAQQFKVNSRGYLTQIQAALSTSNGLPSNNTLPAHWEIYNDNNGRPGSRIQLLDTMGISVNGTIAVSYINGAYSDSNIVEVLLSEGTYWIVIWSDDPTLQLFYNDILPEVQDNQLLLSTTFVSPVQNVATLDETVVWITADTPEPNRIHYEASIIVSVKDEYHIIEAPGIYNLVGEPYIILRCKEIEENSFRYLAYSKHYLGLAKFNVGEFGYNNNRLDFNRTTLREFHPIGKLSKLTFRFETASGKLYDFKGVNHNMTFAIYYYEPIQKEKFEYSRLNPNYTGDILGYMYKQEEQEDDSDDQDDDYNRDIMENYRFAEMRYNPDRISQIDSDVRFSQNINQEESE